jgi:hypothetical protein
MGFAQAHNCANSDRRECDRCHARNYRALINEGRLL